MSKSKRTIWLLCHGSYSDRGNVCAFTDKEVAESVLRHQDSIHPKGHEYYLEELDLDPAFDEYEWLIRKEVWSVFFDDWSIGDISGAYRETVGYMDGALPKVCKPKPPSREIMMRLLVEPGTSKEGVAKIANEKRARLIAEGYFES